MIDRAQLLDAVKEAAVADYGWKPEDIAVGALKPALTRAVISWIQSRSMPSELPMTTEVTHETIC